MNAVIEKKHDTMTIKEYDTDHPVTMASEPAVAYISSHSATTMIGQSESMTPDEYFDKIEKAFDQLEAETTTPPPCQYTEEEAVLRVLQATAETETGEDCLTQEEFESLVEAW